MKICDLNEERLAIIKNMYPKIKVNCDPDSLLKYQRKNRL